MDTTVLVAYATRSGSTEELARAIAETLRHDGLCPEVQRARDIHTLGRYAAVVLAAPLYMFRLHKDARRFLAAHRTALSGLPVALFVAGPCNPNEKEWTGARQQLDKELARFPWFKPLAKHVVGGQFDPAKLGFPFKLIPALKRMPAADARDWGAIRRLTEEFANALLPVMGR